MERVEHREVALAGNAEGRSTPWTRAGRRGSRPPVRITGSCNRRDRRRRSLVCSFGLSSQPGRRSGSSACPSTPRAGASRARRPSADAADASPQHRVGPDEPRAARSVRGRAPSRRRRVAVEEAPDPGARVRVACTRSRRVESRSRSQRTIQSANGSSWTAGRSAPPRRRPLPSNCQTSACPSTCGGAEVSLARSRCRRRPCSRPGLHARRRTRRAKATWCFLSMEVLAAVDHDRLPGHERRTRPDEVDDRADDVLRLLVAPELCAPPPTHRGAFRSPRDAASTPAES